MKNIRIKCPAKINLTLEIVNRREDGFHNINSIMQLISLYDYLNITYQNYDKLEINLSGSSSEIPYDNKNLVYKAAEIFCKKNNLIGKIDINIEKNIPIAAGLAGGSTDAAGTLYGLNKLLNTPLTQFELEELCATLGSDLNVCLNGGCLLATSRGENTTRLNCINSPVTLIKPKYLGISAKEAYTKYAQKTFKPKFNNTEKMLQAINNNDDIKEFLYNDLEYAVYDDYKELQTIKKYFPQAIMSGSGSTYFILENSIKFDLYDDYEIYDNLKFINHGVIEAEN